MEQRINKLDMRVDELERLEKKLESERAELLSMARETVKLSKLHNLNLQQALAMIGRLELHGGDVNERFDLAEQNHVKIVEDIRDLRATMAVNAVDADRIQEEHGKMLREILARLPEKGSDTEMRAQSEQREWREQERGE